MTDFDTRKSAAFLRDTLIALGADWVLKEIAPQTKSARAKAHMDDIALVFQIEPEKPLECLMSSYERTELLEGARQEQWPNAVKMLDQKFPSSEVPVLIRHGKVVYSFIFNLRGLDSGALS